MSAPFTAASLQPVGRQRTIRGAKVHAVFANKHARVEYDELRNDVLRVTVELSDGRVSAWRTIAAMPSLEVAKIAAAAAYRSTRA